MKSILLPVLGIALVLASSATVAAGGHHGHHKLPAAYTELMQQSMAEKFGLEFYVNGQMIPGIVTAISEDGVVEVRNQRRDRIVIKLHRVDAIGR